MLQNYETFNNVAYIHTAIIAFREAKMYTLPRKILEYFRGNNMLQYIQNNISLRIAARARPWGEGEGDGLGKNHDVPNGPMFFPSTATGQPDR